MRHGQRWCPAAGIAVIEDGQLVEVGTHDQLVDHDHTYGQLWRTWQAEAAHPKA